MPLMMKIQPIDTTTIPECTEAVKTIPKSRFKRLFDFSSFLRSNSAAVVAPAELEPGSVCLDKLVESFLEDSSEKQTGGGGGGVVPPGSCGRNNCDDGGGSDDDFDSFNCFGNSNHNHVTDACDPLKSLVACEVVCERTLLADVAKIVDKNKIFCKRKDEVSRKIVVDGLLANGYTTVSICKSKWDKTSTYPAGEYEYIDAVIEGERLIVDIDFRAEFEVARSTKSYKAVLQMLPHIFVGKADRLQKIINIVSDAAKQSLKKKGMPLPPWRRADYVKAKWLSPCNKMVNNCTDSNQSFSEMTMKSNPVSDPKDSVLCDEFEVVGAAEEEEVVKQWEPVEIKPKAPKTGGKIVSGLASVIEGD